MTIINPNSIAGITSVTAEAGVMNFYKSDGTLAGLQLNGVNFNTTAGVSTFNNVYVGGTITYEDVKNVDSIGIVTARTGIHIDDSITHIGDTNTKIRFPGNDQISFETGGVQRMIIGVGGDITIEDTIKHSGDTNTKIRFPSNDTFTVETAGSERLRINSSGQVAINETSPPSYSLLSLDHGSYGRTRFSNHSHLLLQNKNSTTTEFWSVAPRDNGALDFARGVPDSNGTVAVASTTRMTISQAGKIGINEASPQQQLHIHDDTIYKGILINGSAAPRIGFARDTTTSGEWSVGIDGTNGNQFAINNSNDNSNRKVIISSSEISLLSNTSVSGDVSIADKIIHTGDTNTAIRFPAADTIAAETGGAERLRIQSDGTLRVGGSYFTDTDIRLQIHNPANTASQLQFTGTGTGGTAVSRGFRVGYNGSGGQLWNFEDNYVRISTNNAEKIRVHNRQLTTIGYTGDPGWSTDTGYYNVVLGNSSYFRSDTDGSGNFLNYGVNAYRGSSAWQLKETGRATQISHSANGTIEFYVSASGSANNNVTWNDTILKITHEKVVIGHSDTEWLEIPSDERCIVFDQGQKMITSNDGQGNFNIIGGKNHEAVHVSSDSGNSGIAQIQLDTDGADGNIQFGVGPTRGAGSSALFTNGFKLVHQSSGLNGLRYITGSNSAPSGLSSEYVILNKGNCEDGSWNTDSEAIFKVLGDGGSCALTTNDGGGNCNVCFNCASEVADTTGSAWRIRADIDSANGNFYIQNDTSCNSGGATGMTSRLTINQAGTFTGSSSNNISDVRLKKNIATITNATAKIKGLTGRTFEWKEEARLESGIQYGFIAQEMETVVSDLVTDGKEHGLRSFDKDGNMLMDNYSVRDQIVEYSKGVNVDGVIPILVEALKEAISEIETLKTKVAALES